MLLVYTLQNGDGHQLLRAGFKGGEGARAPGPPPTEGPAPKLPKTKKTFKKKKKQNII